MSASAKAAERGEPSYVWRAGQARRLDMIRQWADVSGCILDAGCGLGAYLNAFAPFSDRRYGIEIEADRAADAAAVASGVAVAAGETLPFADATFDFVFSNEVIEHVVDDRQTLAEMVRVTRPGGRDTYFLPQPLVPGGAARRLLAGQLPFRQYLGRQLPARPLRNRLAPHVRTYTGRSLRRLLDGLPVRVLHHSRIYGGYDNIERRLPRLGRLIKRALYAAEGTPLALLGISHLLVVEKT